MIQSKERKKLEDGFFLKKKEGKNRGRPGGSTLKPLDPAV